MRGSARSLRLSRQRGHVHGATVNLCTNGPLSVDGAGCVPGTGTSPPLPASGGATPTQEPESTCKPAGIACLVNAEYSAGHCVLAGSAWLARASAPKCNHEASSLGHFGERDSSCAAARRRSAVPRASARPTVPRRPGCTRSGRRRTGSSGRRSHRRRGREAPINAFEAPINAFEAPINAFEASINAFEASTVLK